MKQHGESGVEPESATDAKAAPATHSVVVQYVSQSFYEAPSFPRGLVMQPCRRGHVPLLQVLGLPIGACHHRVCYLAQRGEIDWRFPIDVRRLVLTHLSPNLSEEEAIERAAEGSAALFH